MSAPEWAKQAEVDLHDVMNDLIKISNYSQSEVVSGLIRSIVNDVNEVIAEVQEGWEPV